jgi:hypothetical protein
MTLTADQQAMLQLLLERGQSYEDLASVLGVGVDEVRSRARAALAELGGADPDAQVGLTDYLLGQADPIGRADAVRQLQGDPEARQLASELLDRLRELAPGAQLPELPKPRERRGVLGRRAQAAPAGAGAAAPQPEGERTPSAPARLRETLSRGQQQMIVALVAGAVIVIAVVLLITGAFDGDDEAQPAAETPTTAQAEGDVLTTVPLRAQGGSDATGEATFGLATGDQPYVDLTLENLSTLPQDRTYVVWLLLSGDQGYPLSPLQVSGDGSFSDRFPIPQFAIPIASRARFVDISLSENRSLLEDLRRAVNQQRPVLGYQGDSVLRGEIPAQEAPQGQGGQLPGGGGGGGGSGGSG